MKEFTIGRGESGQRFDKYLGRLLPEAPVSFLYRMLRKKNITLNHKKAEGRELLAEGDLVTLFLSEETFDKFAGKKAGEDAEVRRLLRDGARAGDLKVLYEDEDILLADKPAGLLTQRAEGRDVSVNDWLLAYLLRQAEDPAKTAASFASFRPSACNRLDRNTSGIILCGKTLRGARFLSQALRDRTLSKYYLALVRGAMPASGSIEGYLTKDRAANKVALHDHKVPGAVYARTLYRCLGTRGDRSLVEADLVTGRSHQLRAMFAWIGHPILGDPKYEGRPSGGRSFQRLHCWRVVFPRLEGDFAYLSGREFTSDPPESFDWPL